MPQLIRNVVGDEAALLHVAGDPLLIPRHARSGRHCQTPAKITTRHNTETIRAKSTKRHAQQDAMKNKTPTVDGKKSATSMKWQTSISDNNRDTNKQLFRTPVPNKTILACA